MNEAETQIKIRRLNTKTKAARQNYEQLITGYFTRSALTRDASKVALQTKRMPTPTGYDLLIILE